MDSLNNRKGRIKLQMVLQHEWKVIIITGSANHIGVTPFPGFGFMPFLRKQESRGVWGKVYPGSKMVPG